jgi:hypothetical protein
VTRGREPQISPLRYASVEMTKGRVVTARSRGLEMGRPQVPPLHYAFVYQLLSLESLPSPLSSRPKRSAVERSAVQRSFLENVFRPSGKSRATPRPTLVPAAGRRSRGLSPSGSRNGRRRLRVRHSCWSPAAAGYRRSSGFAVWQRTLPVPST